MPSLSTTRSDRNPLIVCKVPRTTPSAIDSSKPGDLSVGRCVQGATEDCASLQAEFDSVASMSSAEQLTQAKVAADEGAKLCAEGKTAEGAAKLKEAISHVSAPSQQPSQ